MPNLYDRLIIPEENRLTSIRKEEAEFLYDFLKDKDIKSSLEVWLAYWCSTCHIISATDALHYAIDPYQDDYGNIWLKNVRDSWLSDKLIFVKELSHNALPKLSEEWLELDFAFIDWWHKFDDIFIDFYYIDLMLVQWWYVLFHDNWMKSTKFNISWILNNKPNYTLMETNIDNLVLLKKDWVDNRLWSHFEDFSII
ncbi:MAG: hypothetical protein ACD_3C00123G0013 [uncultured bacterium (gcode 4)]|uniref:Uncharacterized protein n=1 Tax=uncultured bacterium (gcode 4) TaxID=1234023 RepID=K2G161_9BACT|nr:MAG: hypothetical protein ACD_3C00123G0013 [uncultured bacterium (gcode 4)]